MNRAFPIAAALLLLAGCERPASRSPFFESLAPPGLPAADLAPEGWAWGAVQVGEDPPQRYGVASPDVVPQGQAVIVPAYGETAEAWFSAVRTLNGAGLTVWVLDRAGQGGSGRFASPRDLGHVSSFEPDVRALEALVGAVVRPSPDQPLTLLARGDGAAVAIAAAERGLPADRIVLWAPHLASRTAAPSPRATLERWMGLDRRPPRDWKPWAREDATKSDPVGAGWQLVNPDLRMSGPSRGWVEAHQAASAEALAAASSLSLPVLQLGRAVGGDLCPRIARCRQEQTGSAALDRASAARATAAFALERSAMGEAPTLR